MIGNAARDSKGCFHPHLHKSLPESIVDVFDWSPREEPGVVDYDVKTTKLPNGKLDHSLTSAGFGEVLVTRCGQSSRCGDLGHDSVCDRAVRVRTAEAHAGVADDHGRAELRRQASMRGSESAARPGYDGDLSIEPDDHRPRLAVRTQCLRSATWV
jgi:hypothetical protein